MEANMKQELELNSQRPVLVITGLVGILNWR